MTRSRLDAGLLYEADVRREDASRVPPTNPRVGEPAQTSVTTQQYYHYQADASGAPSQPAQQLPAAPQHLTPHEQLLRTRLIEFYTRYNPSAVARVDRVMALYKGRDAELWHALHEKYLAADPGTMLDLWIVGCRYIPCLTLVCVFVTCRGREHDQARLGRFCLLQRPGVAGGQVRLLRDDRVFGVDFDGSCASCDQVSCSSEAFAF